jgi:hypothetical protein
MSYIVLTRVLYHDKSSTLVPSTTVAHLAPSPPPSAASPHTRHSGAKASCPACAHEAAPGRSESLPAPALHLARSPHAVQHHGVPRPRLWPRGVEEHHSRSERAVLARPRSCYGRPGHEARHCAHLTAHLPHGRSVFLGAASLSCWLERAREVLRVWWLGTAVTADAVSTLSIATRS